jgi:hypothetical protein
MDYKNHTAIGGRCARDLRAKVCGGPFEEKLASPWFARSFQTNYKFSMSINYAVARRSRPATSPFRPPSACVQ